MSDMYMQILRMKPANTTSQHALNMQSVMERSGMQALSALLTRFAMQSGLTRRACTLFYPLWLASFSVPQAA